MRSVSNKLKLSISLSKNGLSKLLCFNQKCNQTTSLKVYKLESALLDKILSPQLKHLFNVFEKYNFKLRICGGAIRDILMKIEPHDVDLATDAKPDNMLQIFDKEKIRIYNRNGLKHGTLSIRLDDKAILNFNLKYMLIIM